MIAFATVRALEADRLISGAQARMPFSTFRIGIGTPMRPVEQTRMSSALILNQRFAKLDGFKPSSFERDRFEFESERAANTAICSASRIPCAAVAAFAFPEFTTIARAKFLAATFRLTWT